MFEPGKLYKMESRQMQRFPGLRTVSPAYEIAFMNKMEIGIYYDAEGDHVCIKIPDKTIVMCVGKPIKIKEEKRKGVPMVWGSTLFVLFTDSLKNSIITEVTES